MKIAAIGAATWVGIAGTALAAECTNINTIVVPGAQQQLNHCLEDLSTRT